MSYLFCLQKQAALFKEIMTLYTYDAPRLGLINDNGGPSKLKGKDIASYDAARLCILVFSHKTQGKKIVNHYSIRALASEIEREMQVPLSSGGPKGRKKRLTRAKDAVLKRHPGLTRRDLDLTVEIARYFYPETDFYQHKRMNFDILSRKSLSVIVDENISEKLVERFASETTRAFHVNSLGLRSHPDKSIWMAEQCDMIVTEDMDFLNIAASVYVERVKASGKSGVGTSDMPFVVYIERVKEKSNTPRANNHRGYDYMEEEVSSDCKGYRRAKKQKSPKQDFNNHKFRLDIEQIKAFNTHLKEIIRLCEDPFRPIISVTIKANGNLSYHSKHDLVDRNFRFMLKGHAPSHGQAVVIDGRPRIYAPSIQQRTPTQVFNKARFNGQERAQIVSPDSSPSQKRRYGRTKKFQGPNRRHHPRLRA